MKEMNEPHFDLGKAIGQSRLSMPSTNFEQQVMARYKEETERKKSRQYNWYSILFFVLFMVMGYVVSTQLTGYLPTVTGFSQQSLKLMLQAAFVLCILFRAEYFVKYFRYRKLGLS